MSLYNMVNGANQLAPLALTLLASDWLPGNDDFGMRQGAYMSGDRVEFGRVRDAEFVQQADVLSIVVLTRNGGGNRPEYQGVLDDLKQHPWWTRDEDDEFDPTYCWVWFTVPADVAADLLKTVPEMTAFISPEFKDMKQRTDAAIERMGG